MLRPQSKPRIRARPALGRRNPSSVRIRVDLPAPLGPSNPTAFPVPETPRRQVIPWRISRRPSLTFRLSSSTTAVIVVSESPGPDFRSTSGPLSTLLHEYGWLRGFVPAFHRTPRESD